MRYIRTLITQELEKGGTFGVDVGLICPDAVHISEHKLQQCASTSNRHMKSFTSHNSFLPRRSRYPIKSLLSSQTRLSRFSRRSPATYIERLCYLSRIITKAVCSVTTITAELCQQKTLSPLKPPTPGLPSLPFGPSQPFSPAGPGGPSTKIQFILKKHF